MKTVLEFLGTEFSLGSSLSFTPGSILFGIGLIIVLAFVAAVFRKLLRLRIFPRAGLSKGVSAAMSTLVYYIVITVGLLLIMPLTISGFNMQTLSVVLGAVSFGIGFGMRNIADNFISGIILLIERPVKVGDRIEVGGIYGTVMEVRGRATIVRTNDEVDIIIPNSEFISGRVTNASYGTPRVRFRIPVGVHYNSDVNVVSKALVEAGMETEGVLQNPPPRLVSWSLPIPPSTSNCGSGPWRCLAAGCAAEPRELQNLGEIEKVWRGNTLPTKGYLHQRGS